MLQGVFRLTEVVTVCVRSSSATESCHDIFSITSSTRGDVVGAIVPEGVKASEQANFVPFDELVAGTGCDLHKTADINSPETREWL